MYPLAFATIWTVLMILFTVYQWWAFENRNKQKKAKRQNYLDKLLGDDVPPNNQKSAKKSQSAGGRSNKSEYEEDGLSPGERKKR